MNNNKTPQLTKVEITPKDVVKLTFEERVLVAPKDKEESSQEIINKYTLTGQHKPHQDFLEALLGCRKFALDLNEFNSKDAALRNQFTVRSMEIKGNMELQQSRVAFKLNKYIKRTGKNVPIPVSECVMYGGDYKDAQEMVKHIEALIKEAFQYLNGKNAEQTQLAISFPVLKKAA